MTQLSLVLDVLEAVRFLDALDEALLEARFHLEVCSESDHELVLDDSLNRIDTMSARLWNLVRDKDGVAG